MHQQPPDPVTEVRRLQRCMNDLVSVLALPAVWSVSEPSRILETFLDALLVMLDLDFLYARVRLDSHEAPIDALKTNQLSGTSYSGEEIRQALKQWSGEVPQPWPEQVFRHLGEQKVFPIRMGIEGELGLIVAGSQRVGFPEQTESLVLSVAANQAAIGLQQALRLNEQKRVASELDRRVAEGTRELAETNEELQLQVGVLQRIPVAAWTLKPDGTPDFVNHIWLKYTGQTIDFVRSHPEAWMAAVHPEDRETASSSFWDGIRSGQGFAMETRFLRAQDGTYRWHLNRAVALRDAEGRVLKFVGTSTDIDDRKRAEDELKRSEARHRVVIETASDAVVSIDEGGAIILANLATKRIFGYNPEELIGKPLTLLMPEAMRELHQTGFNRYLTTGQRHMNWQGTELTALRKNGEEFPVEVSFGEVTRDSHKTFTGFLRDVSKRKQAEQALRRSEAFLADGQHLGQIGSYSWRVATDEITWSAELYRIYELEIGVPVTLELIRSRVHPEDVALIEKMKMVEQAREGGHSFEWQFRLLMPDRSIKYMHAVAHATLDQDGQLEYIASVQDVTARRLAEEARDKARSELTHVARVMSLGTLTASIAHELNQPLSGIVTNASTCTRMLAADPPNVDGARETARRTIRDAYRASEVITRLRALFGKKETTNESVDLNDVTREVLELISSELHRNRVVLEQEFAGNLPTVTGDRVQLQQVILNLLRNASESMSGVDDRPRQLLIRTERDEDDRVRLTVKDAGAGFAPQAADRLFESFYTTKNDGMGIGLSVSRSIVEAHHGRLWATRNDGPGSTFAFSIPCDSRPQIDSAP